MKLSHLWIMDSPATAVKACRREQAILHESFCSKVVNAAGMSKALAD